MDVILFRHGIAEERRADLPDADRQLTDRGRALTQEAASGLARILRQVPDVILTSPKARALQTAQILGAELDLTPQIAEPLATGDLSAVMKQLVELDKGCVALVGHEPDLSALAIQLCAAEDGDWIQLKKAGAIGLRIIEPRHGLRGNAVLRWIIPPRVLRAVGGA